MNILVILLSLGALFLFISAFLRGIERKTIFFQLKDIEATPEYFGLPFEDIYINAADKTKLHGWFIPNPQSSLVLLFFHGNGGNISHRLHKVSQLYQLGVSLFLLDYRGYGNSCGKPSVSGIYKDAEAALGYLLSEKKVELSSLVLYGESLGTALAVKLASCYKTGGLILDGAFSCGRDMAKIIFPYLPSCCIPDIFNSLKIIKLVRQPKLFIHSKVDEIVPFRLAEKLYRKAEEPKEFSTLIGGHNTFYIDSLTQYLSAIKAFLAKVQDKKDNNG